jgi:uncharacterized protein (DUF1810 family)
MKDPHRLERFVRAQDPLMEKALAELRAGRKESHWMWFVFPQLRGLGHSAMAERFGISSLEEARAYLDHPVLGPRLIECTKLVNEVKGRPAEEIFGYPDDMKFLSSMTLFAHASSGNEVFEEAVKKYFGGKFDGATLQRLGTAGF